MARVGSRAQWWLCNQCLPVLHHRNLEEFVVESVKRFDPFCGVVCEHSLHEIDKHVVVIWVVPLFASSSAARPSGVDSQQIVQWSLPPALLSKIS